MMDLELSPSELLSLDEAIMADVGTTETTITTSATPPLTVPVATEELPMEIVEETPPLPLSPSNESEEQSLDEITFDTVGSSTPRPSSRELKSILALSKEARLDTNLASPRRKDVGKTKEGVPVGGQRRSLKSADFPVTAESELESFIENTIIGTPLQESPVSPMPTPKPPTKTLGTSTKIMMMMMTTESSGKDQFCWRCHHNDVNISCETCPRSYHLKCLRQTITDPEHWPCLECVATLKAENVKTRSKAMREMTLQHLCYLLKFAVKRMIQCEGSEPFIHPVEEKQFPEYKNYIVQPMTLTMLEKNIKDNLYGSTQAFEADAKWILHNSIIFNSWASRKRSETEAKQDKSENLARNAVDHSKLTTVAKTILKICKQEMAEIENCPSCYLNANTKKNTWFVEVCPKPHLLVWAKLKGFPYWPAKTMSFNSSGMVDVRFFGAHDKSWVSVRDCYLYSVRDPNSGKQKRNDIAECVKELEVYVENLTKIYGKVNYFPFKTQLEAGLETKYMKMFLPSYGQINNKEDKDNDNDKEKDGKKEESLKPSATIISTTSTTTTTTTTTVITTVSGSSSSSTSGKSEGNVEAQPQKIIQKIVVVSEDELKGKLEGRSSLGGKPKWIVKPLKTIVVKKRPFSDTVIDKSKKFPRRDSLKLIDSSSIRVIQSPEIGKNQENSQSKFKITNQLIKKLANLDETIQLKNKKNEEDKPQTNITENKQNDNNKEINIKINENKTNSNEVNSNKIIIDKTINTNNIDNSTVIDDDGNDSETEPLIKSRNKIISQQQEKKISTNTVSTTSTLTDKEKTESSEVNGEVKDILEKPEKEIEKSTKEIGPKPMETDQAPKDGKSAQAIKPPESEANKDDNKEDKGKKRKRSLDGDKGNQEIAPKTYFSPNKMVKLVPIENILQKKVDLGDKVTDIDKQGTEKFIVLKEIRVMKDKVLQIGNNQTSTNEGSTNKDEPVIIKSEVESDDDDVQYMEAKRQYMSALNISEKQKVPSKPKGNEIRTRSKTEKRSKSTDSVGGTAKEKSAEVRKSVGGVTITPTSTGPSSENKEIYIKPLAKMQAAKHKARKSFPTPNYANKKEIPKMLPKPVTEETVRVVNANNIQLQGSTGNFIVLPKLHYTKPLGVGISTEVGSSVITMVPRLTSAIPCPPLTSTITNKKKVLEFESQNYIPQSEASIIAKKKVTTSGTTTVSSNTLMVSSVASTADVVCSVSGSGGGAGGGGSGVGDRGDLQSQVNDDLGLLKDMLPDMVTDMLMQKPPKLKPKPTGVLTEPCEQGPPSTAGPASSRMNSIAQRLGDFFRNLVVETINDLGKSNNPEATITGLKLEIEDLNHRHAMEVAEIRRNVSIVLKDIQKNFVGERDRVIQEMKASNEIEMLKRIEEVKSKQWCAYCSKEAQFYCCWNTSYCDYPCQQKHWIMHMSKCTQAASQSQPQNTVRNQPQPLVLTPTSAPKLGALFGSSAKPQKVYLKRTNASFKPQTPAGHITLVESSRGSFELVGNAPLTVNGKILATTSVFEKISKGSNFITVTAPSSGTNTQSTSANQKVTITATSKSSSVE